MIKQTGAHLSEIADYLGLPKSGAELAERLPILNLSNAGSARNAQHQDYQMRFSYVLEMIVRLSMTVAKQSRSAMASLKPPIKLFRQLSLNL